MTTSQSRNLRKAGAVALSLALAMSMLATTPAAAAKKVKLAKSKITVKVKQTKKVKIKNVKKKQVKKITVKSKNTKIATAKKNGKVAIKVTGKKKGSTKVTTKLTLKQAVGGKKAYTLKLNVTVKKADAAPTEAPAPTVAPTAAPTPVVSGSSITLDKPAGYTCSVNGAVVTVTANLLPATSNETVEWSVADPTIASVSGSGATVNGVATAALTGLKEGKTTVSAKIAAMTASAQVTVEKEKIFVKITDVKQTKANEVVVSFDKDARTDNQGFAKGKFDIDVKNAAGTVTRTIPVNKCTVDTVSGTSAKLALDSAFNNNDPVTVNLYKGTDLASSFDFVASVGDPASVGITKLEYQKDVEEKVEFAVYDAKGIDVTSAQSNIDAVVKLSVSSDLAGTQNLSQASNATITMNKVAATATLTIDYTKTTNTTGKPDFTNSAVITCIEPKPVEGTAHFQKTENVKTWADDTIGTAGFYKGTDVTSVTVDAEGDDYKLSFYAADDNGDAIPYDAYAVSSSNGDKMSATIETGENGKYTNISISGVSQGTATLNVTATKNTKPVSYAIPVTVKAPATKIGSFSISSNRAKVSNAFDWDYQDENKITPKVTDSNGNDVTDKATVTYEVTKPASDKIVGRTVTYGTGDAKVETTSKTVFELDDVAPAKPSDGYIFSAAGAKAQAYTITATAAYGDDTKTATVVINVQDVPNAAYVDGAGTTVKYQVDGDKTVTVKNADSATGTAKLAAYAGGVFAGYVDGNGVIGGFGAADAFTTSDPTYFSVNGSVNATDATKINGGVYTMIQGGAKWGTNGALYNRGDNFKADKFTTAAAENEGYSIYAANDGAANAFYYSDEKSDLHVAKKGTYVVRFQYDLGGYNTAKRTTNKSDLTVTVANTLYVPKVSVENRTLESIDEDSIKDALKTDVDLNCNTSNNASITGLYGAWDATKKTHKDLDFTKNNVSIGYVSVSEGGYNVFVPISAAFQVKA